MIEFKKDEVRMDVSVIIPTKNGGSIFKKVSELLKKQITTYSYEVICIDSGSSDCTVEIIKENDFTLYQIKPEDFGHGKTRNYGASKANGEYLMFITQDALPYDEYWIQNFIDAMKKYPNAAGGFGKHLPYPDCNIFDKKDINGLFAGFGDEVTAFKLEDKERYEIEEGYRHYLAFYSDNNSCMRKDIWEKIPYDDVEFAEDQIWARKIIELGYEKVYCPTAIVYHSHNYKLRTYFSRYYDEYKGLYNLHKFILVKTKKSAVKQCIKHFVNEFAYTIKQKDLTILKKIKWINYSFWRNIYRYRAGYIAGKYHLKSKDEQLTLDKKYSQQYQQRNA